MGKNAEPKKVTGSIDLLHHVVSGQNVFALAGMTGIDDCAGQPDGTSCGSGCTCISEQPYYSSKAIEKLGIRPDSPV